MNFQKNILNRKPLPLLLISLILLLILPLAAQASTINAVRPEPAFLSALPVTLPAPAGFKTASAGYDAVKLQWNAVFGADGYQATISLIPAYFGVPRLFITFDQLIANRTYTCEVRAYRTVAGHKVYSSWTSRIYVKTLP